MQGWKNFTHPHPKKIASLLHFTINNFNEIFYRHCTAWRESVLKIPWIMSKKRKLIYGFNQIYGVKLLLWRNNKKIDNCQFYWEMHFTARNRHVILLWSDFCQLKFLYGKFSHESMCVFYNLLISSCLNLIWWWSTIINHI